MFYERDFYSSINYDALFKDIHGKNRKNIKLALKHADSSMRNQLETFNKYCGKEVLYVHARIGGNNWNYYNGLEVQNHPLFLTKVDDTYDNTYCDIYFSIPNLSTVLKTSDKVSDTNK